MAEETRHRISDSPIKGGTEFQTPPGYKGQKGHGHATSFSTTRKAVHKGRSISVRTTYRIDIDGEPLTMHTTVLDDGTVHCHGLPNYSFASAVDLARAIVDAAPLAHVAYDALGGDGQDGDHGDGHGGHGGHH